MNLTLSTDLDASADAVWGLIKKSGTFLHVSRGLLGMTAEFPEEWTEATRVRGRLWPFHVLPGWVHELHVVRVDEIGREIQTAEGGGLVHVWNHTLRVKAIDQTHCRYTDVVEIHAGLLTSVAWLVAALFFRYRQARLRRYARRLAT
jgi:hypothetical protein